MALSNDKSRQISFVPMYSSEHGMAASATIYAGSFCGLSTGRVRALQSGDRFAGIAWPVQAINGSTAGGTSVTIVRQGILHRVAVTGATGAGQVGLRVYASDDDTLTTAYTNLSDFGQIIRFNEDDSTFDVHFFSRDLIGTT